MVEQHHIFVLLYASVTVLSLVVASVAWRRRAARGALPLAGLMLGIAIWSGATAAMWYVPTLREQAFWLIAEGLGFWVIPVAVLILAFDIAGIKRWRTPGRIALLSIASIVLANIQWLNPGRSFHMVFVAHTLGPYTYYKAVPGPLYWPFVVFAVATTAVCLVILFRVYLRSSGAERTQAAVLFFGGLLALVAAVVTESGFVPLGDLNLTLLAFLATGALWLVAILRGTLLDILPVARDVLVEQMVGGVVVLDAGGYVADVNPAALTMLHRPRAEVLGRPAEGILGVVKGATALLGGSGPRRAVLPIDSGGDSRYVEFGVTPLVVGRGGPPARLVTLHDVTEERRANERLELARTVFDTVNEGIVVTLPGADQQIIDVNDAFCRMTGRSREDSVGRDLSCLQSDRHSPEFYKAIRQILFTSGEWNGEVWQRRADGTEFPSWLSLSVAKDDQGQVRHAVGVLTDITDIREAGKLRYNATHDALTGLPNRFVLDDRLDHALAHARRAGDGLAVLFVDLDNFKGVNDALGHSQGDALLVEVAKRLVAVLRESDTVGRPGGDEFFIIITDAKDPARVEVTARRVLEAVSAPCRLGTDDVHIAASIGIALFPTDGVDATSLVQHADLAMYGAKRLGRNRIQFFSEELQEGLNRRVAVEKELLGGLEEDRCFILYHPQVDVSTGRITGAEALPQLRSRDGTVLSAAEFMPVAEYSELIVRLGDWVLRRACAELAMLHEVAPDLTMSLSFSARQLRDMEVTSLRDVLRTSGVEARSLALEISETAFLVDPRKTAAKLGVLRDVAGIRVSLGGFGTGDSSLTCVRMFRADTIKIDRSFVQLLPGDPEAQAIVLSAIALAKGLQATVIAEGTETEEQVGFLRANGCDCAQGPYFSRPVPADELSLLLRSGPFPLPDVQITAGEAEDVEIAGSH
ncbi:MAG: EAL domain-containing protein [Actinobacteria bacterium]|nr:EAL domain-containing protein [Actinomycetota bacterium]